jgi:hypothetical protein
MPNLVLIPCWRRADFLAVTLAHIRNANRAAEYRYIFLVDRGYSGEVRQVIRSFPLRYEVQFAPQHPYEGNSFNVLEGYRRAVETSAKRGSRLIYLIEEDVWIGKDFFDFHEAVQSQFDPFCVSAVRSQNDATGREQDPAAVYYHAAFQSLGLSWKIDRLREVTKHARPEYYSDMWGYVQDLACGSAEARHYPEQDGLINQLVDLNGLRCMYPFVPRAFHAGFVGYNRPGRPLEGPLKQRAASLIAMSADEMNDRASKYKDISPINLTVDHRVTRFVLR